MEFYFRMWNKVSKMVLSYEKDIEWFQSIVQFAVLPKFIPKGRDALTDEGILALGPNRDQLPADRNVTFFFDYAKGSIEQIQIINTTNGVNNSLGIWNVTDKFRANLYRISYSFPEVFNTYLGIFHREVLKQFTTAHLSTGRFLQCYREGEKQSNESFGVGGG